MKIMRWTGVLPAITTPFQPDFSIDHGFLVKHSGWLVQNGCKGVVALGSLGEGGTLSFEEKIQVLESCRHGVGDAGFVVAGISAMSTADAVKIARAAESAGCDGIMVLPPYVYQGDWREMKAHVSAVLAATKLPAMLYNNPVAYGTDFLPVQVNELLREHASLDAIKESSADIRRVTALRALSGSRLTIACGVDDAIIEAVYAGAVGWVAGVANAFPHESVELFELASAGEKSRAFELYSWFLPLLRMDTVPKFVQLIKLVQERVGMGSARVRPPRLQLAENELAEAERTIAQCVARNASSGVGTPALQV